MDEGGGGIRPDLVFDIGANTGQDSEAYLARGYRVVAVEANPALCAYLGHRFKDDIASGRLTLVGKAISPQKSVELFVNTLDSGWGTTRKDYAERGEKIGGSIESVVVDTITIPELTREFGIPSYLKIDIEGLDVICLHELFGLEAVPPFISIERPSSIQEQSFAILLMRRLGYSKFQIIDQTEVPRQRKEDSSFELGSTGLFGVELPKSGWTGFWSTLAHNTWIVVRAGAMRRIPIFSAFALKGHWFDIHACT